MKKSELKSLIGSIIKEALASEGIHDPKPCNCGSGLDSYWANDARGIPLKRVCPKCRDEKLKGFRQDVLDNPNYEADEPIEPDDYEEGTLKETPVASRDYNDPKVVAHTIWQPVYLTRFVKTETDGSELYEVLLFSASGPRHVLKKTKEGEWFYFDALRGKKWFPFSEYLKDELHEMSATGGVAGYSTPFAFTKNKKGSPRGIKAAEKYGKVVKDISEETKK